ncbi:hypothetical protein SAMN02745975_01520 [Geosporobacter subterraneus DSM 17957]|uniref:Tight adherence protein C n=1 Tax=Geosporobacter subterraneus DSM 17957 TaxID=1121919 RepID=A0A1M6HE53_9FIRM|nr:MULTISPECIES: hypothetical protein [Clostridia]SHJ20471.1 hypothetical protein SAMN02745975_01520 [Geosporobacter subterraneus DSM 17957]
MFYQIIVFILLTAAGILICRQLLKIPKLSMKKNIKNVQAEKEAMGNRLLNRFIMPLARPVSRFVPLNPVKEARMASILRRGGLELTPKEYYARAIVCASFTLPLALLFIFLRAVKLAPLILLLALLVYRHFMTDLKDRMKEKKKRIEMELPGFVRSILYRLEDNRHDGSRLVVQVDLIQIFEDYLKVASDAFQEDVAILVMEMKAKDIETALRSFNERLGITDVSFLVNALIGLYRGEHQGEALSYLARDMDIKAKEAMKKKLDTLPRRVKIASIPLVAITIVSLLYVIGSHLIRSMGGLF